MYKYFILILSLSFVTVAKAQDVTKNGTPYNERYSYNIGYFGYKLSNAGVQFGIEKKLATTNDFNIIGGLQLNYYSESNVQSGLGLHARFGQRFTTPFGLFLETYLGMGIQQTFYTNKTYVYDGSAATITDNKTSKTGISPSINLGIGYDFNTTMDYPIKLYIRPSFYWLYPERNLLLQTSHALEIGIIYTPNRAKK
jgi:hypothetical protein